MKKETLRKLWGSRLFVSIGTKLASVTILVLAIVATGVFVEVSRNERSNLLRSKEVAATMVARLFSAGAAAALTFGDERGAQEQVSLLTANDQVVYGALWSLDAENPSRVAQKLGEVRRGNFAADPMPSAHAGVRMVRRAGWVLVETPVLDPGGNQVGVAQVALSLAQENDAIRSSQRRTLWGSLATALGLAIVLLALTRTLVVRPVERLAAAAKRLERGESVDIEVQSNDEVGRLARGFDTMSRAIENREHRISERNRDLRRVLDNAADGFLTVDITGLMSDERSGVLDVWFGPPPRGSRSFLDYMDEVAPAIAPSIRLGWEELREDVLPQELVLYQLPHRFERQSRYFEIDYRPIHVQESLEQVLVVIRDVTQQVERERAEQGQRELAAIVRRVLADREGFRTFFQEAAALVAAIESDDGSDPVQLKRNVHTLKGNSALFGLESITQFCHRLELRLIEDADSWTKGDRTHLRELWSVAGAAYELLGGATQNILEIAPDEHRSLLQAIHDRADYSLLASIASAWRFERASVRLARASEQLKALARALGKGEIDVRCEVVPGNLRLPQQRWSPFWTAFAHVLRNTIDHGIESPAERAERGKTAPASIALAIRAHGDGIELSISDDGLGIDWERIRSRAAELGLPHASDVDLEESLYADGVSSRSVATETSGRGIGMSAVRQTVRSLGGYIEIETARGSGTMFRFVFPKSMLPRHMSLAPPPAVVEGSRFAPKRRSIAAGTV